MSRGTLTIVILTVLLAFGAPASAKDRGAASAPDGPRGLLSRSPKGWGLLALSAAIAAVLGGVIVPLALKRRRSGEDGSPPR